MIYVLLRSSSLGSNQCVYAWAAMYEWNPNHTNNVHACRISRIAIRNIWPAPNVLIRFVCWACRISRTVHMTYESLHTTPTLHTHEANCDTDDPNRDTYHPHNLRDTNHSYRRVCIKGSRTHEFVTQKSSSSSTSSFYTQENMPKIDVSKRKKKPTQKRTPPPPDDDSEGSDIDISQSNRAKKFQAHSKPNDPTPAVSDENKSDDAYSSHSTSNSLLSSKSKYKTPIVLCSSLSETCRNGSFIASCQLFYSLGDFLQNLGPCWGNSWS